jgi:hypothetical protein
MEPFWPTCTNRQRQSRPATVANSLCGRKAIRSRECMSTSRFLPPTDPHHRHFEVWQHLVRLTSFPHSPLLMTRKLCQLCSTGFVFLQSLPGSRYSTCRSVRHYPSSPIFAVRPRCHSRFPDRCRPSEATRAQVYTNTRRCTTKRCCKPSNSTNSLFPTDVDFCTSLPVHPHLSEPS